jgi:hypothetical protein
MKASRLAMVTEGALRAYLAPKLAMDAGFQFKPVLKAVDAKRWTSSKKKIAAAVTAGVKGKLAQDADINGVLDLLDQLDEVAEEEVDGAVAASDPALQPGGEQDAGPADPVNPTEPDLSTDDDAEMMTRLSEVLKANGLDDQAVETILAAMKPEVKADPEPAAAATDDDDKDGKAPPFTKKDEAVSDPKDDKVSKPAMDAAIAAAVTKAQKDTVARMNAIREAEKAVFPFVGAVNVAMDSAEDVYKMALDAGGVDLKGVPTAAYRAMVSMLAKPGSAPKPKPAMDAAKANDDFAKRFPGALSLKAR